MKSHTDLHSQINIQSEMKPIILYLFPEWNIQWGLFPDKGLILCTGCWLDTLKHSHSVAMVRNVCLVLCIIANEEVNFTVTTHSLQILNVTQCFCIKNNLLESQRLSKHVFKHLQFYKILYKKKYKNLLCVGYAFRSYNIFLLDLHNAYSNLHVLNCQATLQTA